VVLWVTTFWAADCKLFSVSPRTTTTRLQELRMRTVKFVSLLLLLTTLSSLVLAQTATSSLRGTVTDPKGAVIPGATVTLTNPATGYNRTTKTDSQGVYQFLSVPPAS